MKTCTKCGLDSKDDAAWCPTCLCTSWATVREMTKPTYFVAATKVFELVTDPSLWVKAGATTLDGAKRLATKNARGTTFTARVATENAKGDIQTVAELHNSFAITRRRPKWRLCVG